MHTPASIPPLAAASAHDIESRFVGDRFRIFIARPLPATAAPAPVVLALDGNASFGLVTDTARLLALDGQMPQACIVGIGYPADGFPETASRRTRDCTPTRSESFETLMRLEQPGTEPPVTGGALRFLRFIADELLPWLRPRLPEANVDDIALLGSSFGGLFASFALLQRAAPFRRYVIGSPSLWWDREALLRRTEAMTRGRVFISCGAEETEANARQAMIAWPDNVRAAALRAGNSFGILEPTEAFIEALRSQRSPELRLDAHVFPDENHSSVIPAHVSRGLRVVFQPDE